MNGPRTNQFVAPTSFITSISRRREKIERRIVFAISSVEAISSTITAARKTISITRATRRIRSAVSLPYLTLSTPGRHGLEARRDRVDVLGAAGMISYACGSGFEGRFSVSSGNFFSIRSSALSLRDERDRFRRAGRRSGRTGRGPR